MRGEVEQNLLVCVSGHAGKSGLSFERIQFELFGGPDGNFALPVSNPQGGF
jgi:GTPase involved in cell partitioning and DNA repair